MPSIYYKIILGSNFEINGNAEAIYDMRISDPFFLRPGESKTIEFNYTLPKGLAGKHLGIIISSFLENGMPLGWSFPTPFDVEGEFSYVMVLNPKLITEAGEFDPEEGPTLHKDKNINYQVTLSNLSSKQITLTPKIDIYRRVILPPTLKSYNEKNIILNPKEKKQITFQLPNFNYETNVYAGTITFVNSEGKRQGSVATFRYVVLGKAITIENISSSHTNVQKNASFTIKVDYSKPFIDTFTLEKVNIGTSTLNVKVFNEQEGLIAEGNEIIDFALPTKNKIFNLKAKESAQALRVEAKIFEGKMMLGEYSTNLSPDYTIQKEKSKSLQSPQRTNSRLLLIILLVAIVSSGLILWISKKHKIALILFFGVIVSLGWVGTTQITNAYYQCDRGGWPCRWYPNPSDVCVSEGGVWDNGGCTKPQPLTLDSVTASPNPAQLNTQITSLGWSGKNEIKIVEEQQCYDYGPFGSWCSSIKKAQTLPTTCTLSGGGYSNLDITQYQAQWGGSDTFAAGSYCLDPMWGFGGGCFNTGGPGFSPRVPDEGATYTITCRNSSGSSASSYISVGVGGYFTYTTPESIRISDITNPWAAIPAFLTLYANSMAGTVKPGDPIYLSGYTNVSGCTNSWGGGTHTITTDWGTTQSQNYVAPYTGSHWTSTNGNFGFSLTAPSTPGIHRISLSSSGYLDGYWEFRVVAPPPTISSFVANPTFIAKGSSSTLSWSTQNITSCTASASPTDSNWSGNVGISNPGKMVFPTQDTTYTLTCAGPGGTTNQQRTIKVLDIPIFSISPTEINRGQSATLIWITKNASACTASSNPNDSGWSGVKTVTNDSQKTQSVTPPSLPPGYRNYSLTCTGLGGIPSITKSIAAPGLKVHTLLTKVTCSKDSVTFGDCATLKVVAGSAIYLRDDSEPTPILPSLNAKITDRKWTFSNGKPPSCPSSHAGCTNPQIPKVSFLTEGTQTATLVVTDSAGETETITKTFKIAKPSFQETAPQ
ncbi:MAG: hypothetical protein HZA36_03165 [Parcubacteria group bacterium]|nr:hypothetical protein [Parcubacteria group bacterium]